MNQYRCETCKNCSKNPNDDYFCLVTNDEIDFTDFNHTARVGCASHSDFQNERDKVLDELKRDLKTRFVSSDNQWGRGRNSGLLECCNIIGEYLKYEDLPCGNLFA